VKLWHRGLCTPLRLALLVAALAAAAPSLARADMAAGQQLAQRWCAACHIIGGAAPQSAQPGPPSFHAIAESGKTPDQLRAFLTKPHGAMPDLALSRAEIDDVIAYIEAQGKAK
jgi:mono/diheme cytochrome c family protein